MSDVTMDLVELTTYFFDEIFQFLLIVICGG